MSEKGPLVVRLRAFVVHSILILTTYGISSRVSGGCLWLWLITGGIIYIYSYTFIDVNDAKTREKNATETIPSREFIYQITFESMTFRLSLSVGKS